MEIPSDDLWAPTTVSFSFPQTACRVSAADAKIITCQSDVLTLETAVGWGDQVDRTTGQVDVKNAVVQMRMVNEVSTFGIQVSGYELAIASNRTPILAQRYFNDIENTQTTNCKINN